MNGDYFRNLKWDLLSCLFIAIFMSGAQLLFFHFLSYIWKHRLDVLQTSLLCNLCYYFGGEWAFIS